MERPLTHSDQIILVNHLFNVDLVKQRFADPGHPHHHIAFGEFKKENGHRSILIDPDTRNVHAGWHTPHKRDGYEVMVRVPEIIFKQSLSNHLGIIQDLNGKSYESKHNFRILDEATRKRINGVRPLIYCGDHAYKFLIENKALVLLKNNDTTISTRYMHDEDDMRTMSFLLDKNTLQEGRLTERDTKFPDHLSVYNMPNPTVLDPVGDALLRGKSEVDFLVKFPYKSFVLAKEIPWQQSVFAKIIDQNIAHQNKMSEGKKSKQNNFGIK